MNSIDLQKQTGFKYTKEREKLEKREKKIDDFSSIYTFFMHMRSYKR